MIVRILTLSEPIIPLCAKESRKFLLSLSLRKLDISVFLSKRPVLTYAKARYAPAYPISRDRTDCIFKWSFLPAVPNVSTHAKSTVHCTVLLVLNLLLSR